MGTFDNLYLNRIKQLQEENNNLRAILNEAMIRGYSRTAGEKGNRYGARDQERQSGAIGILTRLVNKNDPIHDPVNADELASFQRVLADMDLLNVTTVTPRNRLVTARKDDASEGGPGTGTADRKDMERYVRAVRALRAPSPDPFDPLSPPLPDPKTTNIIDTTDDPERLRDIAWRYRSRMQDDAERRYFGA
jgi:hypothetical protein